MGGPSTLLNGTPKPAAAAAVAAEGEKQAAALNGSGGAAAAGGAPTPAAAPTVTFATPFTPQLSHKPSLGGDGASFLSPSASVPITPGSEPPSTCRSFGLAMMGSLVDESKLRHVSSKDELEAAFRKREVAVTALKAKMSKVGRCLRCGRVAGGGGACAVHAGCGMQHAEHAVVHA